MHAQTSMHYAYYIYAQTLVQIHTILFSTGYSQTDLLVAHYTGNRQSTVQHLRSHIEQYGEEEINGVSVYQLQQCVQYFVSRFPTHKLLRHNAYTRVSTTYTQTIYPYTQTVEVSTGPGRMRARPGSVRARAELF